MWTKSEICSFSLLGGEMGGNDPKCSQYWADDWARPRIRPPPQRRLGLGPSVKLHPFGEKGILPDGGPGPLPWSSHSSRIPSVQSEHLMDVVLSGLLTTHKHPDVRGHAAGLHHRPYQNWAWTSLGQATPAQHLLPLLLLKFLFLFIYLN